MSKPRKRSRGSRVNPVSLQFAIKYALPKDKRFKMTKKVIEQAIKYWIDEGEEPEGFEITPILWEHENRMTEADDPERFRVVLGRLLQAGAPFSYKVRRDERV